MPWFLVLNLHDGTKYQWVSHKEENVDVEDPISQCHDGTHTIIYFNPAPGSSMQFNTIKCIEQRVGGSRQRWQRPGWARNAFRILHNILFPIKSFKIAARSFRVPWLVGSSHYSPITTLPYHYNTFLAGLIWPVPVLEMGSGVSIKKVHWVWERERIVGSWQGECLGAIN